MRIIAPIVILALAGLAAPAASACRVAAIQSETPIWFHAPSPDQVRPGEVALEVAFPSNVQLVEASNPDEIIIFDTCRRMESQLFQIVRVLAGDARGAKFVILPGGEVTPVFVIDPATDIGESGRWFAVGTLNTQSKYAVYVDDPTVGAAERTPASLNARWPPQ